MKKIINISILIFSIITLFIFTGCAESTPSNEFSVKFKDYDGTLLKEEIVLLGDNATAPEDPVREGYIFIGWDRPFVNITKSIVVIAQYEKINDDPITTTYTVTFYDYDGDILKEEEVEENKDATPPVNPTREHYNFTGWNKEYTNVTSDLEIVANYSPITYTMTFDTDGGTPVESIQFSIEIEMVEIPIPTKEGYNFLGWYEGENKLQFYELKNYNLKAKWEKIEDPIIETYQVTFNSNGGTPVESQTVEKGNKVVEPTQPTKEGYTFDGWYLNDEKWSFIGYVVTEDITLVAKWQVNTYNITYDTKGATINENPDTYEYGTGVTLKDPVKVGYIFIGWYDNAELSGEPITTIPIDKAEDIILYARWDVEVYTITFDSDGGVVVENMTFTIESKTFELPVTTRTGYTFLGWFVGEEQVEQVVFGTCENIAVVAKWTVNKYTITFDSNGGSDVSNIEFTIETQNIELPTPTKFLHDFLGWYEDDILVETFEPRNYNLVAKWEKRYTTNLDIYEENGKSYINFGRYPQTVVTDESIINALSTITSTNELGYIEYNGNEYAKVVANPRYDDYTFINGNSIVEGNIYYFLVEPIKWRVLEENNGTCTLLSEMIIDNMIFYHTYNQNRTINETTIYPNNYEYSNVRAWLNGYDGSSYNVSNYTNKGFLNIAFTEEEQLLINTTLVDNSLESTGESTNIYICNNTQDKIYLLSYKDTLNTNYGFSSSNSPHESREAVVSDYARSKYCIMSTSSPYYGNGDWRLRSPLSNYSYYARVVGYYGDVNDYNYVHGTNGGVRPALTIDLNESTNKNKYTITFDSDGGSSVSNIEFTIETQDIELPTPTKDGYDFLGWYEDDILVETFEYRDYNLIAKWEKIEIDIDLDIYEENGYTYINLGRYPQTVVTDESVINALSLITTTNELGYIEYNGNEYAKVVANPDSSDYRFINGTTITKNNTYYFLVEPIKWRVLEENNGTYTLLSEMILDNPQFYNTDEDRTINGTTIYPNNYEYSNVRAWLNGYDGSSYNVDNYTNKGFLNIAFTEEEQLLINTTLVDNSLESTGDSTNGYICNNTQDKIYLLSRKDTLNTNYGFSSSTSSHESREAVVSDYVRSKYCYMDTSSSDYGNGYWWLRSPNISISNYARVVYYTGNVIGNGFVYFTGYGVRPALTIDLNESTNKNKYTITFDSDGGSSVSNIEFTIETQNIELPTPIKDGYDFLGWYENDILVETFEPRNYNLVAKWEKRSIDIEIYEENGKSYINFGRYPQTVVTDESVVNALSTITTTNELGYYEYNDNEYAKVVANPWADDYTFINGNTIIEDNTYYFLVEPIKWRVLEENNGTYTLLSEMILDNPQFYHTLDEVRTINDVTIYPNNYEYSNIRAWLNGYDGSSYNVDNYTNKGFLNIAFTEEEQLLINTTPVDNSLESTGDSTNGYICNNTQDKIYLLSRKDAININYGFSSDYSEYDTERRAQVSDYARSKNCYMSINSSYYGNGYWWLRSPSINGSNVGRVVSYDGHCHSTPVNNTFYGVRPALIITIE